MRRIVIIVLVVMTVAVLGYLAHTFDLLGLAKAVHSTPAQSHG